MGHKIVNQEINGTDLAPSGDAAVFQISCHIPFGRALHSSGNPRNADSWGSQQACSHELKSSNILEVGPWASHLDFCGPSKLPLS